MSDQAGHVGFVPNLEVFRTGCIAARLSAKKITKGAMRTILGSRGAGDWGGHNEATWLHDRVTCSSALRRLGRYRYARPHRGKPPAADHASRWKPGKTRSHGHPP